jgi:hypothetical protein
MEIFEDFAVSTLASSVSIGATSLTLQTGDGAKYPSPSGLDFFKMILFNKITAEYEFVTVTSRLGDVCTCSATTIAFNAGDIAENRPSKDFFNGLAVTDVAVQQGGFLYGVDTGATDAYVVLMSPAAINVADGQEFRIKIGAGNNNSGGACTIKFDALTEISVSMEDGSNPPANSIKAGFTHTFIYDGVELIFQSQGLALTTSGFNALNKQIKNVAAGTAANDVATIGLAETLLLKTLVDPVVNGTPTGTADIINPVRASGTFTFTNITHLSPQGGVAEHGLGNIRVKFGMYLSRASGGNLDSDEFTMSGSVRYNDNIYYMPTSGLENTSFIDLTEDGWIGVFFRNATGVTASFTVDWWVEAL